MRTLLPRNPQPVLVCSDIVGGEYSASNDCAAGFSGRQKGDQPSIDIGSKRPDVPDSLAACWSPIAHRPTLHGRPLLSVHSESFNAQEWGNRRKDARWRNTKLW
jgi:hypothetical protein